MSRRYENEGRDQFNFENVQGNVILEREQHEKRSRSESILLRAVADEVTSRLSQSLHNAVLINLDKQIQPQQVRNPLSAEIKIGALPSQPLPPGTEILEVFERSDISGRLLILGDPGAGKTTTLLDLAKGLVERAIADSANPIPVIFALSSWKDPKQEMKDWLIAELKSKYGVRIDIGKKWIEDKQLLPLLDGLDEVKPEHQESCVNAINRLLQSEDRPSDLVVCSRREEYETYETRLQLNGAICLQDLTNEQIQGYLREVNQSELWQMVQPDAALLELVRKPLFLSITVLSYGAIALEQWQRSTSTELRLKLLFDAYWESMIIRQLVEPRLSDQGVQSQTYWKAKPPNRAQTRRWLAYLAKQLQQESQIEFLIEEIQPQDLSKKLHQWQYWLLLFSITSLYTGLIITINFLPYFKTPSSLGASLIRGILTFGLFGGFISSTESKADGVRLLLFPFLAFFCLLFKRRLPEEFRKYVPILHDINLLFKLRVAVPSIQTVMQDCIEPLRMQSILFSNLFFIPLAPLIVLIHGVLIVASYCLRLNRLNRILRVNLRKVTHVSVLLVKENYDSLYSHHLFLIGGAIGYIRLLRLKGQPWLNVLFDLVGLFIAPLFFFLLFPLHLIPLFFSQQIDKINTPNQGLHEGVKIALFVAVLQSIYLYLLLNFRLVIFPWTHAASVMIGFILTWVCLPLIKHLALRLVLWYNQFSPWDYARFLNYATERLFLQRVGGRYRFIHKLLQDHFAEMEL